MQRFHFDVMTHGVLDGDNEGVEFTDYCQMQQEAMSAAGSMVSEMDEFPREPWTMVIRDERQNIIKTLTFAAR